MLIAPGTFLAPAAAQAPEPRPFVPIFNGKSFDGWNKVGDVNWRLVPDPAGDYAEADKGSGFLVSANSYGNFTLKVEFWADTPANSGIFIRCADPKTITADSAYEVNIFDQRPDPKYRTGGIVNVAEPKMKVDAGGKWHTYEITADGDHLTAKFDGVVTADGRDSKHASGPIALQYSAGVVRFRKVQISELRD
ncbi:MAG: DUF1080 domain-containing protein [Acidobacteria bacterium]|nr:DUF1080 domain-containing protein [Acidobacteriota bacterium]